MDDTEYVTRGHLEAHQADVDSRFGGIDQDIKLLNERLARRDVAARINADAPTAADHVHVAPGHGEDSTEVVTGPAVPRVPAATAATPAPAVPKGEDPW